LQMRHDFFYPAWVVRHKELNSESLSVSRSTLNVVSQAAENMQDPLIDT
jgi:hypothetical protein